MLLRAISKIERKSLNLIAYGTYVESGNSNKIIIRIVLQIKKNA